ncbi:MAG: methylated-DNA--[protein]-cysteine S-methyltransferase [Thermoanaerobaculia bacterium]
MGRQFRLEALEIYVGSFETPLGPMVAVEDEEGALRRLSFLSERAPIGPAAVERPERCEPVARQIAEYFDGSRKIFDLALGPEATPFQSEVWSALLEIPYGALASYSEIARRIGRPRAVRAVGAANGAKPIAIVIPCHRVVGRDGSLTGYGAGLSVKRWLLDHEAGRRPLPMPEPIGPPPTAARPAS